MLGRGAACRSAASKAAISDRISAIRVILAAGWARLRDGEGSGCSWLESMISLRNLRSAIVLGVMFVPMGESSPPGRSARRAMFGVDLSEPSVALNALR